MASRAAAIFFFFFLFFFFFFLFFFFLVVKHCPFFWGGEKIFAKMKTKVPSRPFFRHAAASPETEFILYWPKKEMIK